MAGIFGTDGVRARINTGPMRAEAVVRLALATGRWFADNNQSEGRNANPVVVIGKDTRLSGYMLEAALVAGFNSIGIIDVPEHHLGHHQRSGPDAGEQGRKSGSCRRQIGGLSPFCDA